MVRAVSPVVALHGFAGTGRMWDPLGIDLAAPDLPGHGAAAQQRPADAENAVGWILRPAPKRFTLVGYSLGARIALRIALDSPQRVERLVLVSGTAGIEDPAEREKRRAADARLAGEIEDISIEEFAERWMALPLFAGTPPEAAERWREDILRNEPAGLAAALRGMGQGAMEPLWDRLGELTMPVTVMAGERDPKYCAIARRLGEAVGGEAEVILVPGAGHGLPREAPEAIRRALA